MLTPAVALGFALLAAPLQGGPPSLTNGSFGQQGLAGGWQRFTYGAEPTLSADGPAPGTGGVSLRVAASEPSDTAFGQEVRLRPGAWYRVRGWIRTQGLDPGSGAAAGLIQVQKTGGRSVIASSPARRGDTDWSEARILFRAPPEGLTRISLFFVGYGRGVGAVWFDDVRLEEADPSMSVLRITASPLSAEPISPLQYGQFIEYLCDLVPGMWADKVTDGGFEGLTPYNFEFIKETDDRQARWYPSGAVNRSAHESDRTSPVSGAACRRITVSDGTPCTVGVSQDGIAVDRRVACRFACHLRASEGVRSARVRLHAGGRELASAWFAPKSSWERFETRLEATRTATNATLTVEFEGPGALWIDNVSLFAEDAVGGWRRDVVEALRALKPGVIRFGGSVVDYPGYGDYEWRKTIGPVSARGVVRSWGGLQPAGAGLEELVQLMQAVGSEPLICVRFNGSTPEEAAAQVEYFNGAASTPMGSLRAKNGRAAPYGIRFWQVGNEVKSPDYDARLAAFCRAMKAADPSIELLSSYPTPEVLRTAGALIDYVAPHYYGCDNLDWVKGSVAEIRRMIEQNAPGRRIRLAVTEWNTTAGDWGPPRAMLWTLANALACARYHNLMHRHPDEFAIANRSNLTNSFCSGIIQTNNHTLYKTPTYYAQQLYATLSGRTPLRFDAETPMDSGLDVSATLDSAANGRKRLTLFVVNNGPADETRVLDVQDVRGGSIDASVWVLADRRRAGQPDVANSFEAPDRVSPVRSRLRSAGPRFKLTLPAYSLTVLRL